MAGGRLRSGTAVFGCLGWTLGALDGISPSDLELSEVQSTWTRSKGPNLEWKWKPTLKFQRRTPGIATRNRRFSGGTIEAKSQAPVKKSKGIHIPMAVWMWMKRFTALQGLGETDVLEHA